MCSLACVLHFVHCVVARPPSAPRRSAVAVDEDDEDAPAIVDDVDLNHEDNADVQHGSLRAAFPMAFGNCQLQTYRCMMDVACICPTTCCGSAGGDEMP